MGKGGSGTWVRQPKPGSLCQDVPAGVCPGQVAVGSGGRGKDAGHCQHVAEQPAQGQPQQHLPVTSSTGGWLGYGAAGVDTVSPPDPFPCTRNRGSRSSWRPSFPPSQ